MSIARDPWFGLASRTPARIGLGRAGASLPTREVLAFALAHAQARDAVHARLDPTALTARLSELGLTAVEVESRATDRQRYLLRPDLGRALSEASTARLAGLRSNDARAAVSPTPDLAVVIGDGLSATAVAAQAVPVVAALLPHIRRLGLSLAPLVVAAGARVALGDAIGEALHARAVAVLIGERPGLSAAASLGIYLTYAPSAGRLDAERNCISNIRPGGLTPDVAAFKLAWLLEAAFARRLTGVALKDDSDAALAAPVPGSLPR